jgi:hypothetical protein
MVVFAFIHCVQQIVAISLLQLSELGKQAFSMSDLQCEKLIIDFHCITDSVDFKMPAEDLFNVVFASIHCSVILVCIRLCSVK